MTRNIGTVLLVVMLGACGGGDDAMLVAFLIAGQGASSTITSLDFGTVAAAQSKTLMFQVQNDGKGDSGRLTVTSSSDPPFTISAGNCELSLATGETCLESVLFKPTSAKTFTATVTVMGTNDSLSLALTGTGAP